MENTIFEYQLTEWVARRHTIAFAELQLQKYGAKEGRNYCWKTSDDRVAIFTTGLSRI